MARGLIILDVSFVYQLNILIKLSGHCLYSVFVSKNNKNLFLMVIFMEKSRVLSNFITEVDHFGLNCIYLFCCLALDDKTNNTELSLT